MSAFGSASRRHGALLASATILTALIGCHAGRGNTANTGADRSLASADLREAERLAAEGHTVEALAAASRARRDDPTSGAAYLLSARLHERSGSYREAREDLLAGHRADPKNAELTHELMTDTQSYFPPSEAERIAREVIAQNPADADAHLSAGIAIVNAADPKRYGDAVREFQEANRLAPDAAAPLIELGKLYHLMHDEQRAATVLETIGDIVKQVGGMALPPPAYEQWVKDRRTIFFWLSQVYRRQGKVAAANRAAEDADRWGGLASEIRALNVRANAVPPDSAARQRLGEMAKVAAGPGA